MTDPVSASILFGAVTAFKFSILIIVSSLRADEPEGLLMHAHLSFVDHFGEMSAHIYFPFSNSVVHFLR
jgi:hypothetical protein